MGAVKRGVHCSGAWRCVQKTSRCWRRDSLVLDLSAVGGGMGWDGWDGLDAMGSCGGLQRIAMSGGAGLICTRRHAPDCGRAIRRPSRTATAGEGGRKEGGDRARTGTEEKSWTAAID